MVITKFINGKKQELSDQSKESQDDAKKWVKKIKAAAVFMMKIFSIKD